MRSKGHLQKAGRCGALFPVCFRLKASNYARDMHSTASYPCERKNQAVFLFAAACFKQSACAVNSVHAVFFRLFNQVADADGTVDHGMLRVEEDEDGEHKEVKEQQRNTNFIGDNEALRPSSETESFQLLLIMTA